MNKIEIKIRKFIAKLRNLKKRKKQEAMIGKIAAKKILFLKDELTDELIEAERKEFGNKQDLEIIKEKIKLIDKIIQCHQKEIQE